MLRAIVTNRAPAFSRHNPCLQWLSSKKKGILIPHTGMMRTYWPSQTKLLKGSKPAIVKEVAFWDSFANIGISSTKPFFPSTDALSRERWYLSRMTYTIDISLHLSRSRKCVFYSNPSCSAKPRSSSCLLAVERKKYDVGYHPWCCVVSEENRSEDHSHWTETM